MPDGVLPTLRLAVLCGRVAYDGDGRVVALLDPLTVVHVPAAWSEPVPVPGVLYLQLAGAIGTVSLTAEVREVGAEDEVRYETSPLLVAFDAGDRDLPYTVVIDLAGLAFPGTGLYEVFVRSDGASLHDPEEAIPVPYPPVRVAVYQLPADEPGGGDDGDES
ncbi:MAG: hypothetical protein K2X87_33970 [Gemmataceae bacterium]|nr:hypothetical protein [Gemmataceae bacterium]